MQPATPTAPPAYGATGQDEDVRTLVPAPRAGPAAPSVGTATTGAPSPLPADPFPPRPGTARAAPVAGRRHLLVALLVVGPPTALLGAVVTASALDLSAPASMLLAGTPAGWLSLLLRLAAVVLLAVAAAGVHALLLRRGVRPAAAAAGVVLGAAPLGGLALVEPARTAVVAGVVALLCAASAARRRGLRVAPALVLAVLLAAAGGAAVRRGPGDEVQRADALGAAVAHGSRAVAGLGAEPALYAGMPLLVLAAVLARGRARLLLSLLSGAAGLVAVLVGGAGSG